MFSARSDDESLENIYDPVWSIWAVRPDGSNLRRITPEQQITYEQPSVSGGHIYVTGRHWVITYYSAGGSGLTYESAYAWTINLDGTTVQPTVPATDPDVARPRAKPSCRNPWDCAIKYGCEIRDCRSSDEKWRDAAGDRASYTLGKAMIKGHTTPPRDKRARTTAGMPATSCPEVKHGLKTRGPPRGSLGNADFGQTNPAMAYSCGAPGGMRPNRVIKTYTHSRSSGNITPP